MAAQETSTLPYRVGHKIRICLGKEPGDHRVTFGIVVEAEKGKIPSVIYKDYSRLRLSDFHRHVTTKEIVMIGEFPEDNWEY